MSNPKWYRVTAVMSQELYYDVLAEDESDAREKADYADPSVFSNDEQKFPEWDFQIQEGASCIGEPNEADLENYNKEVEK